MIANIHEEMVDKTSEISNLTDLDNSFDVLFYHILEKSMNHSIEEQIPQMQKEISKKLVSMPLQHLKLLDINDYMKEISKSEFFNEIISCAVDKTLSDLPQSFPVIYEACQTSAINLIREIVESERSELISKGALEVRNLGTGFSIFEGTYKKKVFDLHFTSQPVEKKINDDEFLVCRIPDNAYVEVIPFDLQHNTTRSYSSFDEYISQIDSSFRDNGKIGFKSNKLSFSKISSLAKNLFGYSYSQNSPENSISYFLSVNLLAKICLNEETLSDQCFVQPLKNKLNELEEILSVNDIKSPEVKTIISEIYSNYGESIALGFFYGNYEIDIYYNENQSIESEGQGSNHSKDDSSLKLGFGGLKIGGSNSNETNNENSSISQIISSFQDNTKILCGIPENPSIFMYDIALNFAQNTSVKSSFVPLFKFVQSQNIAEALEYWAGRWDAKPETYSEFCEVNDIESIPINTQFSLYYNDRPYNVEINGNGDIIIPNSKIEYTGTQKESFDVVLDPKTMTISGFKNDIFVNKWQRKHHLKSTDRGFQFRELSTKLNQFWSFDHDITKAYFKGDALNYLEINDANSHSFKAKYDHYPSGSGRKWRVEYHANLQQKIKVAPS